MARQLEAKGEKVEKLILIDSRPVDHKGQLAYMRHMTQDDAAILSLIGRHLAVISGRPFSTGYPELSRCSPDRRQAWFLEQLIEQEMFPESLVQGFVTKFIEDFREGLRLVFHHQDPGLINADIILFRASEISNHYAGFPALEEDVVPGGDASYGWSQYSRGQVEVRIVPGTHESLIFEPVVTLLARELSASLSERRFKYKLKFPRSIGSN
jgi:thioesterase domain-containing protein